MKKHVWIFILSLLIWACQSSNSLRSNPSYPTSSVVSPILQQATITATPNPFSTTSMSVTPYPIDNKTSAPLQTTQQQQPVDWMRLPVVPEISQNSVQIFHRGLKLGNRPNAFSKVGDCGSTPSWFLGDFDRGPRFYNLGKYAYLQKVIDYYQGSFDRTSLAALAGYNTSSVLTPLWSDKNYCRIDESPLECEYRIQQPSIALITLGANDVFHPENFETQMRKIIEISLQRGIIPVLATKPDNAEGNHQINQILATLAIEYDIPLWNYWLAVQPLPNHGLQEDGVHITFASNDFSNPLNLEAGWPIRNLTALQVLDALHTKLQP